MSRNMKRDRYAVVGHGPYGLTYGRIVATDSEIARAGAVTVFEARSVRYWYGRKGGITSLAAFGPCGPRVAESRIGAPTVSTLVLDVKAVHVCTDAAIKAFAKVRHDV